MLSCFAAAGKAVPVEVVLASHYCSWHKQQRKAHRQWLSVQYKKSQPLYCLPDAHGNLEKALFLTPDKASVSEYARLAESLPVGVYTLEGINAAQLQLAMIAWVMAAYRFTEYQGKPALSAQLQWPKAADKSWFEGYQRALYLTRDLINLAANDLMPDQLAAYASDIAKAEKASCTVISGEALLENNFPAIYTVGKGSQYAPCLIDLHWGKKKHPKLTLVGKGVCYDTGGLSLKPTAGMVLMKKDMGGAAHVLGLASFIMQQKLDVQLRVLIPAVDNAVSGNAYRPGDVITMRNGKTVEVTNTDAEGRLVLADALALACEDLPDLLIDFATLTGAARVALGTELPALFCNNDQVAKKIEKSGAKAQDALWRLPLHHPYFHLLSSDIADLVNSDRSGYAGAITAALFLEQFVVDTPWAHIDLMAWNTRSTPGKPRGGEAMGLRALFDFIVGWSQS